MSFKPFDEEFGPNIKLAEALGLDPDTTINNAPNEQVRQPDPVPPPSITPPPPAIPKPLANTGTEIEDDTDYARQNLLTIIEQGQSVINLNIQLLQESGHPRVSESLSLLLKTQAENIDKLLKIHKDKKELDRVVNYQEGGQQSANVTNIDKAIIFQGTSDELVRMIRSEQKKNVIEASIVSTNE